MTMSARDFFNSVIGRRIWYEKNYGYQCVGILKYWCEYVANVGAYPTENNNASGFWIYRDNHSELYDFIVGADNFQNGDFVIWDVGSSSHPDSHVAMYMDGCEVSQNQYGHSEVTAYPCSSWNDAMGALRPKGVYRWGNNMNEQGAETLIRNLYKNLLDRDPSDTEVQTWKTAMMSGMTASNVVLSFVNSDECREKNYSNNEFVKRLYLGALERDSDDSGLNNWQNFLDSMRVSTASGFVNGSEFESLCKNLGITK